MQLPPTVSSDLAYSDGRVEVVVSLISFQLASFRPFKVLLRS